MPRALRRGGPPSAGRSAAPPPVRGRTTFSVRSAGEPPRFAPQGGGGATATDGTLTVFANGKRIGQATGVPKDREWFPISFSIGGWSGSRARFRGRLDDVLLYDYPRSEAEIEADAGDR